MNIEIINKKMKELGDYDFQQLINVEDGIKGKIKITDSKLKLDFVLSFLSKKDIYSFLISIDINKEGNFDEIINDYNLTNVLVTTYIDKNKLCFKRVDYVRDEDDFIDKLFGIMNYTFMMYEKDTKKLLKKVM